MNNREICWYLTTKCNENCKYCHRFLNIEDLEYEQNEQILRKLIDDGVKAITWTGGEALLYKGFIDLLKIAKENGIKSKLITNGTLVANNNDIREVCNYLDSLTLSIDSIDEKLNTELGRGKNHFNNIKTVLEYLKDKDLKVNINTVVSKVNINQLEDLGNFISNYKIKAWRIFKFIPLRETAKVNKDMFEITTEEFNSQKALFESFNKIPKVEYRQDDDFEDKYIIIMSNGDVVKTENNVDIKIGNVFEENLKKILQNYEKNSIFVNALKKLKEGNTMNKIRTIVAHNDDKARNLIINTINTLDFVDVVGTATNGINTYNKIVELQPDMVFAEYRMSDMDGIELIKKSKEKLENKTPMFNIIGENIPFEEIEKSSNVIGDNINALVNNNDQDRIINILKEYREYKEFMNIE